MTVRPWLAKQCYWASLFRDNWDPPLGGYYERLERRIGEDGAKRARERSEGLILALVLLIGRWVLLIGGGGASLFASWWIK
jgi:hypothetical protein